MVTSPVIMNSVLWRINMKYKGVKLKAVPGGTCKGCYFEDFKECPKEDKCCGEESVIFVEVKKNEFN